MFNQTVYNGLVNIVPFWSSNLIQLYGLGNEYNVAFNLILTEVLKMCTLHFSETMWFTVMGIIIVILTLKKIGFTYSFNFWDVNSVIIVGKEIDSSNGKTLDYCNKIKSINKYLLGELKIKNITYVNNTNIIINCVKDLKIANGINLTISRSGNSTDSNRTVTYTLWTYKENLEEFVKNLLNKYNSKNNFKLVLIGNESNNLLNYPLPIEAINYWVSLNYKFPKLKCLKYNDNTVPSVEIKENSNDKYKEKDGECTDGLTTNKNNNYTYTLDNIINFEMDDVNLTITRDSGYVYYNLTSDKVCCKQWVENKIQLYSDNKIKFKNKFVINGQEITHYSQESGKKFYYPKLMWVINWLVIDKLKFQNYECVCGDNSSQYKYILEPIEHFKLEDDILLTVKKVKRSSSLYGSREPDGPQDIEISYILNSNEKCLKTFLENIEKEYDEIRNKTVTNKIIYHFIYNGMRGSDLSFQQKVLSESNTERELFETFDKLHNEHVSVIKNDIDKLKNLAYYRSHGLKRKKGYLFHGIPGCGKTAMVVAMALYDSRHIVEIPFSLIKKHEEFEKLMNLKSINGTPVDNNNIIILFDEIDIGMEKIGSRNLQKQDTTKDPTVAVVDAIGKIIEQSIPSDESAKLNLGTLLSKLDGIGNYNGLIFVGTTNCIDKLDPALYRELRMTPIEFKKLRKVDCIEIIESYFGKIVDTNLFEIIKDNKITPVKLITLCQVNEHLSINDFFNKILSDYFK